MRLGCRVKQTLNWLLWVGGLVLLLLSLGLLAAPPVAAEIHFLEEAPGRMVYQSRQTLRDTAGHSWQAIAFKRVDSSDNSATLYLRLVGFPGAVNLNPAQPLTVISSLGDTLTAPNVSSQIFSDQPPEPNVGQFDLQSVLPQIETAIPLQLLLSNSQGAPVEISIEPAVIEEWKIISSCQTLMCNSTSIPPRLEVSMADSN